MRAAFRRTVVTVLSSTALAAAGVAAAPAGLAAPAEPASFTMTWHEHPVDETGYVGFDERATLTNDGRVPLTLVAAGADGNAYSTEYNSCTIAPGESCDVAVAPAIMGGDYPEVITTELFATMRTASGTTLTRKQLLRLPVVDTPPPEPHTVVVPLDPEVPDRPAICLGGISVRFRVIEPSTVVGLVSDRFGDLLKDTNPYLQRSDGWSYSCQRVWVLLDSALAEAPTTDVVHMTYVDDEGNRVTTDYPLTYPTPPKPAQRLEARLVADPSVLAETGEVAHLTLTVRNSGDAPAAVQHLTTRAGRDLAVERHQPQTGTVCTGSLTIEPGASLTCRYTSQKPLSGQAGTTERVGVTVSGSGLVDATAQADLTFRDVPPDARVTLARPAAGGWIVTVTGVSAEPGLIEAVDVIGLGNLGRSTCTPGARLAREASYTCTIGDAAAPGLARPAAPFGWLPLVVAVRLRDDDGTRVTAYGWGFRTA